MDSLIRQLTAYCVNVSASQRSFRERPEPTKRLILRATQLAKDNLLCENSAALVLMNIHHDMHTLIRLRPAHTFYVSPKKADSEISCSHGSNGFQLRPNGVSRVTCRRLVRESREANVSVSTLDEIWSLFLRHCRTTSFGSNE
ncbi:hypothetical protein JG687_00019271 [Phytophthora cactorum]|uniref:Uncharacterized protein n=1 Tax=Phytophthora cactorum TaxID=29920 RepID=A0A8T1TK11_9STRA|nr:hypothetical protein GQ600_19225 [Phytophthora cactorum]KAG6942083.1 hypothetical protein JG687_00019271 [Phytophthora cactorum]